MKKMRVILSILLVLVLLTGCGAAASKDSAYGYAADAPAASMPYDMEEPMEEYVTESEDGMVFNTSTSGATVVPEETVETYAEKIIYQGYAYVETTEFDEAVAALEQAVRSFGGFIQESGVNGRSKTNSDGTSVIVDRWSHYVVRIPAKRFDEFMTTAGTLGNVTSSNRNAENVTSQYTDYEARLSSLTIQEERLLEMLKESGDLESLIQLEARLSEVRYEIESIQRNLRNLDQRISYSTVTLELQEVEIYTPTASVQRSFGEKIGDSFRDGWQSFARGWQDFVVGLVYALPVLVLLAVIGAAAVVVVISVRKKIRRKKQAAKTEEE